MAQIQEVLDQAQNISVRNKGQQFAAPAELLRAYNRVIQGIFAVTARISPSFYGKVVDISPAGGRWPFPADCNLIYHLQHVSDPIQDVAVVPYDDPNAEPVLPAVYMLGKAYYPATNPPTGDLRFWYSRTAVIAAAATEDVDTDFPDTYRGLLEHEIALFLRQKDVGLDELADLRAVRDSWLQMYVAHVEAINSIERRRRPTLRTFNSPTLQAIGGLLAGGAPA